MNKLFRFLVIFIASTVSIIFSSAIASADSLHVDDIQYGVRKPIAVAECRADGSSCSISTGKTISSTITGTTGITFGTLNASLQGSYQENYAITTTCTSPPLNRGEVYVMFPRGDFIFFNVAGNKGTAFLPTGVFCEVRNDW